MNWVAILSLVFGGIQATAALVYLIQTYPGPIPWSMLGTILGLALTGMLATGVLVYLIRVYRGRDHSTAQSSEPKRGGSVFGWPLLVVVLATLLNVLLTLNLVFEFKQGSALLAESNAQQQLFEAEHEERYFGHVEALRPKLCAGGEERSEALRLLLRWAPDRFRTPEATLELAACGPETTEGGSRPEQLLVKQNATENRFLKLVNDARQYKGYGLDPAAAGTFYQAYNSIPELYVKVLDFDQLNKATRAYQEGHVSEAADRYLKGFRMIPGS
jgi:hypothetical protein